jgi:hypothetical protein
MAALVFEKDIHFEPAENDAIIWAIEGTKRFRLVIRRQVLQDKYGLQKRFDDLGAAEIIKRHWMEFEQLACAAHDAGRSEAVVG